MAHSPTGIISDGGNRLVYGLRPVLELLRAKRPVATLFVVEGGETQRALAEILDEAKRAKVPLAQQPREELDALVAHLGGALHQGVVAVAGEYPYAELSDLLGLAADRDESPLLLLLDGVQDPQNLGALARSAHVLGAHGLVVPKDRAVGVTPAAVKASAGATEHTRIARVTNLARTVDELKERGVWTVGTSVEDGEDPWALDLAQPTAIVLGSEGKGVRPLVLRQCDLRVKIPMAGKVASLNVSASGAILLYEARRQRDAKK